MGDGTGPNKRIMRVDHIRNNDKAGKRRHDKSRAKMLPKNCQNLIGLSGHEKSV
jgi:hypothetical protein